MWQRRDWLYLAYSAALLLRFVWPPDDDARIALFDGLLLPIAALAAARLTQGESLRRWGVWALMAVAIARILVGGSRSPDALPDPLFWGVAATTMLAVSAGTNRWPIAAAVAASLAGASAMVGTALLAFPTATRVSFAALADHFGVLATICLMGMWCQAIIGKGLGKADPTIAVVRGALVAALLMAVAGVLPTPALGTSGIVTFGLLLGLMEATARRRTSAVDWTPVWQYVDPTGWRPIWLVVFVELLFALLLLRAPGTGDVSSFFVGWINTFVNQGPVDGYRLIDSNYPPLAAVVLWIVGELGALLSLSAFLSLKLALAGALLVGTLCIWRWTSNIVLTGLAACSFLLNGVALGYLDTLFAPTFVLSLWALQQRALPLFSVLFVVTSLIKWQPLVILPFLLVHAISMPSANGSDGTLRVRRAAAVAVPAAVVVLLTVAIFGIEPILASLRQGSNRNYLSGNAHNVNWILTYYLHVSDPARYAPLADGLTRIIEVDRIDPNVRWVAFIMPAFLVFYATALYRGITLRASFASAIECSLIGYLSYFMLSVGVHENHLFLGTVLAIVGAALAPARTTRAVLLVTMSTLNLIRFYGLTGTPLGFPPVVGIDVSVVLSAVNVVLFLVFWAEVVWARQRFNSSESRSRSGVDRGSSLPPARV